MPSLHELAQTRTDLSAEDLDWLHLLLADWQLLADLSFADLVLWLPVRDGAGFVAAAHVRPSTGPTAHHDDLVGTESPRGRRPQLDAAFDEQRICRDRDPDWPSDVPVREETVPVLRAGQVVAVVSRHTNLAAARTPSRLELTYLRTAEDLAVMVSQGRFPVPGAEYATALAPRVGDGLIRLDAKGIVTYASPNAVSAYRRLGLATDLPGTHLGDVTSDLVRRSDPVEEPLASVVSGSATRDAEVEAAGTTVRLRVIPLLDGPQRVAALVLCRDVSELRHRERELVGKDATIREMHHRVKNNLQTVAALLRLQARRLPAAEDAARAALTEAERRIASIALVHETLSHSGSDQVDFDEVADRLLMLTGELGSGAGRLEVRREGSFGLLAPEVATPLALVVVELVQNAVRHGRPAGPDGTSPEAVTVRVRAAREDGTRTASHGPATPGRLLVCVQDDGAGWPAEQRREAGSAGGEEGLGLQIVRTLVEGELGGALRLVAGKPRGAVAQVEVPLVAAVEPAG